jgi:hypothetical protein
MYKKECPKEEDPQHPTKHQGYIKPNKWFNNIWVRLKIHRDLNILKTDDGKTLYNIDKLNSMEKENLGSGTYVFICVKPGEMNLLKIDGTNNMFNYTERSRLIEPETGHSSFFKENDFNRQLNAEREAKHTEDPCESQKIKERNCKVLFAGELYYYVWDNDGSLIGTILFWNNRSGHYRTSTKTPNKEAVGLPTTPDLFVSWDDDKNANQIQNTIISEWTDWSTSVGAKKFKKKGKLKKQSKKKINTNKLGSKSSKKYYKKSKKILKKITKKKITKKKITKKKNKKK